MKTIPKTIDEFTHTYDKIMDSDFAPFGRVVPDDLLQKRFAFAGMVLLTREEARSIADCLLVAEANLTPSKFDRAMIKGAYLLTSKLVREEMINKLAEGNGDD